ncbi:MAG: nickel pincer cofactor biosynthesis protein LarC [Deltaproteobacteria bacterium]|nr:nickel pincer cofactor biosynthesis protein LarC [Deltaproteobacteria bacterium]
MTVHLHIDPWNGAAGDMLLAALVDAGAGVEAVTSAVAGVRVPGVDRVELSFPPVESHGLAGRALRVSVHPETQPPHRSASELRQAVEDAPLPEPVRARALSALDLLARAEATVHGVEPEQVHFHEIGGVDTVVDLVGVAAALEHLGVTSATCGELPLGGGAIRCSHGTLPSPAPATLQILRGARVRGVDLDMETVTPTGAALVRTTADAFGPAPAMDLEAVGTGFGTLRVPDRPNCLRVWLGRPRRDRASDEVILLEANLDDLTGELLGPLIPRLLEVGALDAWITPTLMKKGRPGHVVSALCSPDRVGAVEEVFWRETSTLGVRRTRWERTCLERSWEAVATPWGRVRVKVGYRNGLVVQRAPEFEDCLAAARRGGVPLKEVYAAVWRCMD